MTSPDDRLRFAVKLATVSIDDITPAERKALLAKVAAFTSEAVAIDRRGAFVPMPTSKSEGGLEAQLRQLQRDVERIISPMIDVRDKGVGSGHQAVLSLRKSIVLAGRGKFPFVIVSGSRNDIFIELLIQQLATTSTDRIRRCPGCGTVFLRTGRQTHCTRDCYDRSYWSELKPETKNRYRAKQYEKSGWTVGSRAKTSGKRR